MVATYSEAHRQLKRVLDFFFFGCVAAILIGTVQSNWWFDIVWLASAFTVGLIGIPLGQNAIIATIPTEIEVAHQRAFARIFVRFTNLLAATALAAGFALGHSWWFNLIFTTVIWFASLFGILLLCAPRMHEEGDLAD